MSSLRPPLAIFAYRRPTHLARTIDALEQCPGFSETDVYIFSDGPRTREAENDVADVRRVIAQRLKSNMQLIAGDNNRGLAASIIAGVSELTSRHGNVVVIEDDLIVGPATLDWFAVALERYADSPEVMQVSAHMFDVPQFRSRRTGLFLPLTTSWGWATWKRAWQSFDPAATGWEHLRDDPRLRAAFDLGGTVSYAAALERQMRGRSDSWAVRWYWSVFLRQGLVLFPPRSLLRNIGFDGSGTHAGLLTRIGCYDSTGDLIETQAPGLPTTIRADPADTAAVAAAIRRQFEPGWKRMVMRLLAT